MEMARWVSVLLKCQMLKSHCKYAIRHYQVYILMFVTVDACYQLSDASCRIANIAFYFPHALFQIPHWVFFLGAFFDTPTLPRAFSHAFEILWALSCCFLVVMSSRSPDDSRDTWPGLPGLALEQHRQCQSQAGPYTHGHRCHRQDAPGPAPRSIETWV